VLKYAGGKDGDGYTNIEEWLNATDPTKYVDYTNPAKNAHSLHGEKASNIILLQPNTYKHYIQLFNKSGSNKDRLVPVPTREAVGFIPWYFNMPDSGYEVAWKQLMDSEGFLDPFDKLLKSQ
jgi:hypothetical protein